MMSDKQLKVAARELCLLRGVDPDQRVGHEADPSPNGYIPAVRLYSPAWILAIKEIKAQEQIESAMMLGRNSE